MPNVFKKIAGTITGYFKIGKTIKVVNNSGVAEFRDHNDVLVRVKAAQASAADDLMTKQDVAGVAATSVVLRANASIFCRPRSALTQPCLNCRFRSTPHLFAAECCATGRITTRTTSCTHGVFHPTPVLSAPSPMTSKAGRCCR